MGISQQQLIGKLFFITRPGKGRFRGTVVGHAPPKVLRGSSGDLLVIVQWLVRADDGSEFLVAESELSDPAE